MIRNYFKIAWRNLVKNRTSSFINIGGLAVGMSVALLIGLWIRDELSFDKYHQNYKRIAQVMQKQNFNGQIQTDKAIPIPLGTELRNKYQNFFKYIVLSSWTRPHILSYLDKALLKSGNFMGPDAPEMLTLKMYKGTREGLKQPFSVLISKSLAVAFFGDADPINKILRIDNETSANVTGVYEDLPFNTTLHDASFIARWDLYMANEGGLKEASVNWNENGYQLFVQVADNEDMSNVSRKIKNAKLNNVGKSQSGSENPEIFLQPMSKWYLSSEFVNGVNAGGRIKYVRMFAVIGIFVLLLACINFMNLSTARSERRAKEVGILKSIGSLRWQLISQFFSESILVTFIAFIISLFLAQFLLPFFNEIADKKLLFPWKDTLFWLTGIGFCLITGVIAGSYPAFYLSSFSPVKVLKGTFKAGRSASVPRKILVISQFTVSLILIIGTITVFRQIQFTKMRPIGYDRDRLVLVRMYTGDLNNHFNAVRSDLLKTGVVSNMAISLNAISNLGRQVGGLSWNGKTPDQTAMFAVVGLTPEFGKTVGWQILEGRDFSTNLSTDSSGLILNEAAVKYMGLINPVGQMITWDKRYRVIGVVKNIIVGSPYEPVKQAVYYIDPQMGGTMNIRILPQADLSRALNKIEVILKKYSPATPFDYKIVDQEYAKKFSEEVRVGNLATALSIFAIFISSLGVFGLASFVAEQRAKEIGLRKILGATVLSLLRLLSKEFIVLTLISTLIAIPTAYYLMFEWLKNYEYRTVLSWWIFASAGAGVLVITMLTVSYQTIRAAIVSPVKNLRTE